MFMALVFLLFFVFSFFMPFLREMERRDALLVNATLSQNVSLFPDEKMLQKEVMTSTFSKLDLQDNTPSVEPDWPLVLGTFHHTHDDKFEEFLIRAGLSFITRMLILSLSPSVTFERVFEDEDDYHDLPRNDHLDIRHQEAEGGGGGERMFQMVFTTSIVMSITDRFRLGYPFTKMDFDGTPSNNTFVFLAPNKLHHLKEKAHVNTSILHTFNPNGLVTTITSLKNGMQAKRFFRREGVVVEE